LTKKSQESEFSELIQQNQGIIFKVSRMYCSSEECAKDLFQDILLQLWSSYPTYKRQSKFSSWMYRVALNTAISQFRKGKTRKEDVSLKIPNIIEENSFIEKEERSKILYQAIGKLNKAEKSIIILYMDDYSYEEMADIIGISISNVGVKINRTKKKLQQILKELDYGL